MFIRKEVLWKQLSAACVYGFLEYDNQHGCRSVEIP